MSDQDHKNWSQLLQIAQARRCGTRADVNETAANKATELDQLYGPLAHAREGFVVAHLGQSLDGCVATASGHSVYVTGHANLVHLHRLRAMADAIVVGANTVVSDSPRLTTRLVAGPSPVRVVLDRRASVSADYEVFKDGQAQTLLVCANGSTPQGFDAESVLHVPEVDGQLSLPAVRDALAARGLRVLFVEGGGVTVTRFVRASLVDRLHIAIAPVLIGDGTRGIALPSAGVMSEAMRPRARLYRMGDDVLWDLDLRQAQESGADENDIWPRSL